jgi:hypothetical protein
MWMVLIVIQQILYTIWLSMLIFYVLDGLAFHIINCTCIVSICIQKNNYDIKDRIVYSLQHI